MKNQRFVLLITDSAGQWTRRLAIRRRSIQLFVGAVAVAILAAVSMTTHALLRYQEAEETATIREENQRLTTTLASLQAKLPDLQHATLRAEAGFAQIWSKSGLGVEPSLLAVGPIERDATGQLSSVPSSNLLQAEWIALPFEVERIEQDATRTQHTSAELLEYFHDAQRLLQNTPSVWPTTNTFITSPFGRRRDPISYDWLMHKGLDIGGQTGMDIRAPADGIVIYAAHRGGYGQTVVLHHGFGLQTHFAHLSRFRVHIGDRIRRGQVIAEMGSTGKSTGPHLHYEVRRAGRPLDPQRFILD